MPVNIAAGEKRPAVTASEVKDSKRASYLRRKRDLNPCAGVTDLLVFEARPFNHLGIPPVIANYTSIQYFSGFV